MKLKTLKSSLAMLPARVKPLGGTGRRSGSDALRWRGRKLQTWREEILRRDSFLCVDCRAAGRVTPAEIVDHILPLAHGGTYDPENARSLCQEHHRVRTAEQFGRRQRPEIGVDGWPVG